MTTAQQWPRMDVGDIVTYSVNGRRRDFRVTEVLSDNECKMRPVELEDGTPGWVATS